MLSVTFPAVVDIQSSKGPPSRKEGVGLALQRGELCFAVGSGEALLATPLPQLTRCHSRLIDSGRLTMEVASHSFLVSKAKPADLKLLLHAVDEATRRAKGLGVRALPPAEGARLLKELFPSQLASQLRAMARHAQRDAPAPSKGHVRLMMTLDGKGSTAAQVGKQLAEVGAGMGLRTHTQAARCNRQTYAAVAKDVKKGVALEMLVVNCEHHRWPNALWVDVEVAASLDAEVVRKALLEKLAEGDDARAACLKLPHSAMRSPLPAGLFVSIRNGKLASGEFGTRLELRQDAHAAPLGVCDVRYWDESSRVAAPICVLFQMAKETCNAWAERSGRPVSALAPTLVKELEVFVSRLAASSSGAPVRPKVLVAGWEPQVDTSGFLKRQFRFHDAPDKSLGFKLLTRPADASTPAEAAAAKRKRPVDVSPATSSQPTKRAEPLPAQAEAPPELKTFDRDQSEDAVDLGEISQMGKFVGIGAVQPEEEKSTQSEHQAAPVRKDDADGGEEMDDVDAVLAEIGV
ncbi:hypothetical protein AB1Y20_013453 [Prymnesium parvum]|uniref:FACT complex subunit n=1 Tax=Prymnesium parvum TaxID=97485 RepID=A0AB34IIR6_PRYPA